jgi:hypothetical protein
LELAHAGLQAGSGEWRVGLRPLKAASGQERGDRGAFADMVNNNRFTPTPPCFS